ncbi:spermidine synthase [Actinopolyspora sp. H202]|uniref:spermidine synthase n=1 Tax=Actinopolyspora sp. H202 TaxID=1500456 RepID=UPI003EE59C76
MSVERVATVDSPRGEVVLLRRADGTLELRVNGVFVMDTAHTESERMLARTALDSLPVPESEGSGQGARVLIGGLGLGYTLHEVLGEPLVREVTVAELEPAVIEWYRSGLVPELADDRSDERIHLFASDVTAVLAERTSGSLELILLDVDNGPGYLVHDANETVYERAFLIDCHNRLAAGGVVAIWSAAHSSELETTMREVFDTVRRHTIPVTLGSLRTEYHLYLGTR